MRCVHCEFGSQLTRVLLARFVRWPQWQLDHIRPHCRSGSATDTTNRIKKRSFIGSLEDRTPHEQLCQNTAKHAAHTIVSHFHINQVILYSSLICSNYYPRSVPQDALRCVLQVYNNDIPPKAMKQQYEALITTKINTGTKNKFFILYHKTIGLSGTQRT